MSGRRAGLQVRRPGTLRTVAVLVRRDARIALGGVDGFASVLPFVAAGVVLAGLVLGPDPAALRTTAPGLVWLLVLTAAVPLARLVAAAERDEDSWDMLRGLVPPGVLLLAKAVVLWGALAVTWSTGTLLAVLLLDGAVTVAGCAAAVLGLVGVAASLTVFGALLAASARGAGLLAALVLPAGLPALLAGTQAGVADEPWPWLALLVAYDLVAGATSWAVFPFLLEE
ncbi:heme exporter protein CcmB [Blastococcus sp. KM273128]|uniref:heme exporter protein CcmB n=1 Tax=Blastococcus sp. KM273128 TaxID=2570314 RepID=UPI001F4346AA|nr:heme exporter protein CcmB [Blastococcus sp. KM273128]